MIRSARLPILFLFIFSAFIRPHFFDNKKNNVKGYVYTHRSTLDSAENNCSTESNSHTVSAYDAMKLKAKGLSKNVFDLAVKGYNYLLQKQALANKNILTIIDFSKSSDKKRLYVLDIKNNKLLFQSLVAHGRNSGLQYATEFSNEEESHKSSIGFYTTMETYTGGCGYALKLNGCEKGFNDKAYERNIVMHGSEYVNEEFVHSNGYLGRSFGCPAIPEKLCKPIINIIKNGSCLFLYHPTQKYLLTSPILNG